MTVQEKKKISKSWLVIGALALLFLIGTGTRGTDRNTEHSTEPEIFYQWIEIWHEEYPHNIYDFYYDNELPIFEIPSDTVHLKVEIEFRDGDKDSYIRVKLYRWGEDDDYRVDRFYQNAKQGSGIMEKVDPKGTKYYINLDAISGLEFEFTVYAKVPM